MLKDFFERYFFYQPKFNTDIAQPYSYFRLIKTASAGF